MSGHAYIGQNTDTAYSGRKSSLFIYVWDDMASHETK